MFTKTKKSTFRQSEIDFREQKMIYTGHIFEDFRNFYSIFTWPSLGFRLAFAWLSLGFHLAFTWLSLGFHLAFAWLFLDFLRFSVISDGFRRFLKIFDSCLMFSEASWNQYLMWFSSCFVDSISSMLSFLKSTCRARYFHRRLFSLTYFPSLNK